MQPVMQDIPLKQLSFDPDNPRLPTYLHKAPDIQVLEYLLLECNVIELMLSIGEQDFFVGEPLLVAEEKDGRFIVVEGNRRLGALKLLQDEYKAPVMPHQVEQARNGAKHKPANIPCLVFKHRDEILTYLGYRHITGIKEWDALAKARYLRQLRQRFNGNHEEAHRVLAKEIGSKAAHVAKLLAGLALVERARDTGILHDLKLQEDDIPFSLLTTAIGYENICEFIGIENSGDVEGNNLKQAEFNELFNWIFAKSAVGTTVLGESRNLNKLARIVKNQKALEELRRAGSIDNADLYTSGPIETVRKLMQEAEQRINGAQGVLSFADDFDHKDVEQAERLKKATSALHASLVSLSKSAS